MPASVNQRVQRRREAMRAAGLRPLQIWVPDTRRPGFTQECLRQSRLVTVADSDDQELAAFLDDALIDIAGNGE